MLIYLGLTIIGALIGAYMCFLVMNRVLKTYEEKADRWFFEYKKLECQKTISFLSSRNSLNSFSRESPKNRFAKAFRDWHIERIANAINMCGNFLALKDIFVCFEQKVDQALWDEIRKKKPELVADMKSVVNRALEQVKTSTKKNLSAEEKESICSTLEQITTFVRQGFLGGNKFREIQKELSDLKKELKSKMTVSALN